MKRIKVLTIIGARPQIIKAAAISRAIANHFSDAIEEILVHTGQHYDANMSAVFFEELGIPEPNHNLAIGSGTHSRQTALMLDAIGDLLAKEKPDVVLLYGDTNSTLAASMAGAKLHIPIVHIEGGLRSFSKVYPEEINRLMTDHVSTLVFTPTADGFNNLLREGFRADTQPPFTVDNPAIYHCGDIMYDNSLHFSEIAGKKVTLLRDQGLKKDQYVLVTIHRDTNTDYPERISSIFKAIVRISEKYAMDFMIPLHPRTSKILEKQLSPELYRQVTESKKIKIVAPASFLEMIELEKNAKLIMTDSGGVQKEAFFFQKPSVIFLKETPWVELTESGSAILVDADESRIIDAYEHFNSATQLNFPNYYGDGSAAEFICKEIIKTFSKKQN